MEPEGLVGLQEEEASLIVMHRDVHFGGKFPIMLEHYEKGLKGTQVEVPIEMIRFLADWEEKMGQNAAPLLLSAYQIEKVAKARAAYEKLQTLYEEGVSEELPQRLVADLILSEVKDPIVERRRIVERGKELVPLLLELLQSETMHDPLFPGFGLAPLEAARCLGEIGDDKALFSLFGEMDRGDFFDAELLIKAFGSIGEPAKKFLLNVVQAEPITSDNEKAAIALAAFPKDREVIDVVLELLARKSVQTASPFASYLIYLLEGLEELALMEKVKAIYFDETFPKALQTDFKMVCPFLKKC